MKYDQDVLEGVSQVLRLTEVQAEGVLDDLFDAGFEVVPLADDRETERAILAEALNYFMQREGAGHVVEALGHRREKGRWPSSEAGA